MNLYLNTEGGNIGLIAIRRITYNDFFIETNGGLVINSFGKPSVIIAEGIGITENEQFLDIALAIGVASGYKQVYETYDGVKVLEQTGILPIAILSLSMHNGIRIKKYHITPMVLVSPMYLNAGLKVGL